MIDYLEWKQEEEDDALWEAVRQLTERPAMAAEKGANLDRQVRAGEGENENIQKEYLPLEMAVELGERLALRVAELGGMAWPAAGEKNRSEDGVFSGLGMKQRYGETLSENRVSMGRSKRESVALSEVGQAEQLDRVFRRDGRRYDSGFFLY